MNLLCKVLLAITIAALTCIPVVYGVEITGGANVAVGAEQESHGMVGIVSQNSQPGGSDLGEWSAKWWQWAASIPTSSNPLCGTGKDIEEGQSGNVWFLGTSLDYATEVVRDWTIPAGKKLLLPIINGEASTIEGMGTTPEELLASAKAYFDGTWGSVNWDVSSVTIDGVPIIENGNVKVKKGDVESFYVESQPYQFTLPVENFLGKPEWAGTTDSVASGYYLMLAPLSVGEHTIKIQTDWGPGMWTQDVTLNLNVVPQIK